MNIQDLQNVKRIIVHGNCPDGMASAIFLYDALGIEPEFLSHGTTDYLKLEATPGMLFCDISPPPDRYREFLEAGAIVLDHHKKAEEIVKAFGDKGIFADEVLNPGISGGTLAFYHVWLPLANEGLLDHAAYVCKPKVIKMRMIADLIGIADTWQKDHSLWTRSRYLTEALTFYSWEYWKTSLRSLDLSKEMEVGHMIYNDRLEAASKAASKAHRFEYGDLRVGIFNDLGHLTSDVAEVLREDGINVIAGFSYYTDLNINYLRFSLRSDGTVNVSDLALHCDPQGGGHSKAAGFSLPVGQVGNDPFLLFKELFKDYLYLNRLGV